jgi:hypothetical protein
VSHKRIWIISPPAGCSSIFRIPNDTFSSSLFVPRGFTLTVDANAPLFVNGLVTLNGDVSVWLWASSPERKLKSISADVSTVFVCRTSDVNQAKAAMTPGSIPQSLQPSFV